jgi:tetratricopeptide (TPR) repeat protein
MAGRVIPFTPASTGEPSQLLRVIRERCGLSTHEFATLLGRAIDRPDLASGALRAWEQGAVRPPQSIVDAAIQIARQAGARQPSANNVALPADLADLDGLRDGLQAIDRTYGDAPSTSLIPAAGRHLAQIALLSDTAIPAATRRDLDACESEAATLMGQLVWDASHRRDHATAGAYFDQAIQAAQRIGNPLAIGHALLRKSFIALYGLRDAPAGLTLAQQAADTTSNVSSALTGLGLLHAAEAQAMLANRRDCERTLAAAESQLGRIDRSDGGAYLFTEPEFDRLAGSCYLSLGRYQHAQSILTDTAARLQDRQKSRAIVLGNLALAHLRQREIDAAAGILHHAIDLTAQTRGAGGLNLIFKVGRELAPWRHDAAVAHVHDRLHDLMITP